MDKFLIDIDKCEITQREKEFEDLNDEGKEMLLDLMGHPKYLISFDQLMCAEYKVLTEGDVNEEEDEDEFYNDDCSAEFLEFLEYYINKYKNFKDNADSFGRIKNNTRIFDMILSSDIDLPIPNIVFFNKNNDDKAICDKASEIIINRFSELKRCEENLIEIFENINKYEGMKWNVFKKRILKI